MSSLPSARIQKPGCHGRSCAATIRTASPDAGGLPSPEGPKPPATAVPQRSGFPAFAPLPAIAGILGERWRTACTSAVRWDCGPDWAMRPRTCPDDMFMYVEAGGMWTETGGRRRVCSAGDLLHWRRHEVHSAGWTAGPLVVVAIHYGASLADGSSLPERLDWPTVLPTAGDAGLPALLWQAARLGACRPPGWRSRLDAQFDAILGHLLDRHGAALVPAEASGGRCAWSRVGPAVQAMLESLAVQPSATSLARRCGLSPVQFRRVFHQAAGIPPRAWLGRRRIEEAGRLLRDGRPIAEAGAAVGFAGTSAFVTAFRRATGLPPGRWREENTP